MDCWSSASCATWVCQQCHSHNALASGSAVCQICRVEVRAAQPKPRRVFGSAALSSCHSAAMASVSSRAAAAAAAARGPLLSKLAALRYSEADLDSALLFIQERAQLLIHLRLTTLQALLSDSHYRSTHEVSAECSTRDSVEAAISGGAYAGAEAAQKVKYGCLNTAGCLAGVASAEGYGENYLVLRQGMRLRTSVTPCDSYSSTQAGCLAHFEHILMHYSEGHLAALMAAAKGARPETHPGFPDQYTECQFHGPVTLAEDVESLVLSPLYKDSLPALQIARRFAAQFGVKLVLRQ
jgi:hypothetical protein